MPEEIRLPRGEPLSREELDALADITEEDLDHAARDWRDDAPEGMTDLLDAEEDHSAGPK